ncbi:Cytochrome c-type biogenesis protein CycK, partial [Geodia barretti]
DPGDRPLRPDPRAGHGARAGHSGAARRKVPRRRPDGAGPAGCGGAVRLHLGRAGLPDAGLRRLRLLGRDGRRQLPLGQAAALQVHRHMGQSRRLDAALGLDSRGLRRRRGGLRAQPAAGVPGLGAGRAGPDRSRLSGLHCRHLQPLPQARPRAVRRARPQPAAAGSRPRIPPAAALSRLCRALDGVLLRRGGVDRGARERGLGALGQAVDAALLVRADGGYRVGSWWAYYELGWGGYWFWDPVENASFMPWLMATALLHSSIVAEKRDSLKSWTVLLAILGFSLSLLGTFLVRSGVLTSVHSFASDPARGVYILMFLVIVVGGSLTLYAWRAPGMRAGGTFRPFSREGSLLANNLLLAVGCATVFIGTLYPLILDAVAGQKVSVGPPFFESTFVPLMIPLLLMMAVGPLMAWKRAGPGAVLPRLAISLIAAIAVAAAVAASGGGPWGAVLGMALAGWVVAGVLTELAARLGESARRAVGLPRAAWAMSIAHLGVAVLVAGTVGAGNWQTEREQVMRPGDSVALAGYDFKLLGVGDVPGPNYMAPAGRGPGLAGRGGGRAPPARAPPLSGSGHLDHRGRDPHDLAFRSLCRRRRGCTRRRWHGNPHPSQPARALDLDRRVDHGGGRRRLAHRPPPPCRRTHPSPADGRGRRRFCRCKRLRDTCST